ncbi:MAG: hypothetical protein JWO10_975 [Microbacteriaceae bacterium]|nr:hypothetical protein [Microbacteriaceae bacterium]
MTSSAAGETAGGPGASLASSRRLKSWSLILGVLLSGLTLLSWTSQWFVLKLAGSGSQSPLVATGDVAAPALIALALAGLALVAALAIAGPVFRIVLGVLELLIGFTVGLSAVLAIADPVQASAQLVTSATGVSGRDSVASLVASVSSSAWPSITAVAGVLIMAFGVFVVVTGRRWPGSSRKYSAVRLEPDGTPNPVSDWDSLSTGTDPT